MGSGAMQTVFAILRPVVQVGALAWVFYRFYAAVAQTKSQKIIKVLVAHFAAYALSYILKLEVLLWFFTKISIPRTSSSCVVY